MIEHIQICDACKGRTTVLVETFDDLEEFVEKIAARLRETKARREFKPGEKMFSICPECWAHRAGSQ